MKTTLLLIALALPIFSGCSENRKPTSETSASQPPAGPFAADPGAKTSLDHDEEPPPPPPEGRKVLAYTDGTMTELHESEAIEKGLTVVDLSNYWVPFLFSERDTPEGERLVNDFRPIFRKLSNDWPYESRTQAAAREIYEKQRQRSINAKIARLREEGVAETDIRERLGLEPEADDDENPDEEEPAGDSDEDTPENSGAGDSDHYLEVYGIPPSLSVLRKRAIDEIERECFEDVDFERIRNFDGYVAYRSNDAAREDARKGRSFARKMRTEMEKLGITDPFALLNHPESKISKGLLSIATRYEALAEAQKLLLCEKLFKDENAEQNFIRGGLDWKTHQALTSFERKNRIFAWGVFGSDTLKALGRTPRDRLFDAFMRVVAERIIDARAIIEDGSATGPDGKKATYRDKNGETHEVPNLVAEYTATMLKHMNLATPDKAVEFLRSFEDADLDQLFVAVPLPPLPPYYTDDMVLHSVIDRGDVWYEYPYTIDGKQKGQPRRNMPTNTLYVKWNGQDIPLVSMNTTIGSWRTELAPDGYEYYKYKNSDVGPRVWKDIVAGPVWMPPDTTPANDLIKTVNYRGRKFKVPNYDEFGPWYASAYGLVAGFHVRQVESKNGEFRYLDNGIRSHGSVDYNSILRRYSHGCHRLYNHLAIRLFNFVLRHKKFNRLGESPAGYSKRITVDEEEFTITLGSRGYKYELIDPVPVVVKPGNIRGRQKTPIEIYMPKPNTEYDSDAQFVPEEWRQVMNEDTDSATDTSSASPAPDSDSQASRTPESTTPGAPAAAEKTATP